MLTVLHADYDDDAVLSACALGYFTYSIPTTGEHPRKLWNLYVAIIFAPVQLVEYLQGIINQ